MSILILARHSQSQWDIENCFTGWIDVPITPAGEQEAARAGRELGQRGIRPAEAFTSKLQRAQRALEVLLVALDRPNIPVHATEALNERHYGDLQGKNKKETAAIYGEAQVRLWRRSQR